MGRTIGRGTQALRAVAAGLQARRLARETSAVARTLAAEAARLESDAAALRERLAPVIEDARRALLEGEARLAPALEGAQEQALRGAEEVSRRLHPLLAESTQLAERAASLAGLAGGAATLAASRARTGAARARAGAAAARAGGWTRGNVPGIGTAPVAPAPVAPAPVAPGPTAVPGMEAIADATPGGAGDGWLAAGAPVVLATRPGWGTVAFGLGAAQAAFAATFRGPRDRFWQRMTTTGLALGTYAIVARPELRHTRLRPLHLLLGASSAAVLYGTFAIGDRFARQYVPGGSRNIADIYALRDLRPRSEIALRLVTVIAPAEELFWRGMVQEGLMLRFGRWRGAALATAAYGGVHAVTGNVTLAGAAGVAGAHWSALYAAGMPLGALIVSHQLWDVWIFLVQPTGETASPA